VELNGVVRDVLADHGNLAVEVSDLADDDDLYRAGLSSHATVSVMLALEERLGLEFTDEMLQRQTFASVRAIRAALDAATPTEQRG